MKEKIQISRLDQVTSVTQQVKDACALYGVPDETTLDIQLCLMEVLNNAIIHGNKGDESKLVIGFWEITRGYFGFQVEDQGAGLINEPKAIENFEQRDLLSEHGRGIILTKMLLEHIAYNGNKIEGHLHWTDETKTSNNK